MAEKKLIEAYVTKKPQGPVDKGKIKKGLATPPKAEVAGRGQEVRHTQCWQCSGIFFVYEWKPDFRGAYTCPYCGAVGVLD